MPRPPPPAAALTRSGYPISSAEPCGNGGDAGLARDALGCELVATEPERSRRRADPGEPGCDHRLGEVGVLGQEAVARVDSVGVGSERSANLLGGIEIRVDLDRLTRAPRVVGAAVVAGGDGDRLDPEALARAKDASGDLAAVCNDEPADCHGCTLYAEP